MKKTNVFNNIIEYLFIIVAILECNSAYTRINSTHTIVKYIVFIVTLIMMVNVIIKNIKIKKNKFIYSEFIFLIFFIFFILTIKRNVSINEYIWKFLLFLPIMIIKMQNKYEVNEFSKKVTNVVCGLSIISLIFFIMGSILDVIPYKETVINWGGENIRKNYFYLHFDTQKTNIFNREIIRNSGVFPEAPIYAFILCVGVLYSFLGKEKRFKRLIIEATIITTVSSTGIIFIILINIINYLLYSKEKWKKNRLLIILNLVIIPLLIALSIYAIIYLFNNKVNDGSNSYSLRVDDYNASYMAWKEHKILGNGYMNTSETERYMDETYRKESMGQSNAIGRYAAEGGVYMIMTNFIIYIFLIFRENKRNEFVLLGIGMMYLILLTNIPYNLITIISLVVAYGTLNTNNNKIKGEI